MQRDIGPEKQRNLRYSQDKPQSILSLVCLYNRVLEYLPLMGLLGTGHSNGLLNRVSF